MKPHIGIYAPMPRPTARRLSDLHPYARLDAVTPWQWDHVIGRVCGWWLVIVLLALAAGAL